MLTGHHGVPACPRPASSTRSKTKTPLINPFNRNFNSLWDNDIQALRNIPVCSPREATVLATDDLGHTIPDGDRGELPVPAGPE